ncbi:MAG: peptidase M14 [Bacteroidetes bacterium]|nr:MAG: peptidase M14 [Bacteroidota bacterium]
MTLPDLVPEAPVFQTQEAVREAIAAACAASDGLAAFHDLGTSEEGRPLYGVVVGHGPQTVSLIAGAHADEPVGPETLRALLVEGLRERRTLAALGEAFRLVVVPHINPDGEARNQRWIRRWPDLPAYLAHADREPPGRDLEFGFPDMRAENRLVAGFLRAHAPCALHMSLHGMGFAEGGMLLVERHWAGARTERLRAAFAGAVREAGLALHDHNRKGEKGFFYIEPGFTTTPEGAAMRAHFLAIGDPDMAGRFHQSSMEFVRALGGDPLCLVTELPLFVLPPVRPAVPGVPERYLALRERLPEWRLRAAQGEIPADEVAAFGLQPLPLRTAMRLQMTTLELALHRVHR